MKLKEYHIKELYKVIKKNGVKYYDVQTELVDHFAIALEDENKLTFEEKTKELLESFDGKKGLKQITSEKKKIVTKRFFKMYFSSLKEFFSFPKILLAIAIFLGLQYVVTSFEIDKSGYNLMAQVFNIILIMQTSFRRGVFEKGYVKGQHFLILKTQEYLQFVIAIPNLIVMLYAFNFAESFPVIFASIAATVEIIMLLAYSDIRKYLVKRLADYYPELA